MFGLDLFAIFGFLVFSIVVISLLEYDQFLWTTIVVIGTLLGLQYFTSIGVFAWILANYISILWGSVWYVGVGVVWSFIKWYFYLLNERDEIKENVYMSIPTAASHKAQLFGWMAYWPWSALWTLLNDPFKRLFKLIVARLGKVYDKIAQTVMSDIIKARACNV